MKVYTKRKFIEAFEYLKANNFFSTHKEFAQSVGMSPQFLSQILHDNTSIPQDLLMRFFKTYPINLGFFYRDEENVLVHGARIPSSPLDKPVTEYATAPSNGESRNGQYQQPYFQDKSQPNSPPPPSNYSEQNFGYVQNFQKPNNGQMSNPYLNRHRNHPKGQGNHHQQGNHQVVDKELDLRIAKALENATASINELAKVIIELRGH